MINQINKSKLKSHENLGIYVISCKSCDAKYVEQTSRPVLTRFKVHLAHLRYGRIEKTSVAQHAIENNHKTDINCLNF